LKVLRYGLGFLDQGILSLASLLFLILAAQFGDAENLGSFVLGLSTAVLIQSIVRSVSGETLLVRSTRSDFSEEEILNSFAVSVGIALMLAILISAAGIFAGAQSWFFWSLAIAQFGLLVQDGTRFVALARGSTVGLIISDSMYALLTCAAIYGAGFLGGNSFEMLASLGVVASMVSILSALTLGVIPHFRGCFLWIRRHWRLNSALVSEAVLGAVLGYSITLILNFVVSGAELAAYRSVLSIFGLTSIVINFLRTIVLRDLRESNIRKFGPFWHTTSILGGLVLATVGTTYVGLVSLPVDAGSRFFGATWPAMTLMLGAAAANRFFAGLSVIPTVFLRVQGVTWRATAVRIGVTLIGFGLGPVGALLAGARGALLAEALAYGVLTVALMVLSRQVASRGRHRLSTSGHMKRFSR